MDELEDEQLTETLAKYKKLLRTVNLEIWSHPEVRFTEYFAHDLLTNCLEGHGFRVTRKYLLPTGFRAEFLPNGVPQTPDTPNICFICEYDALPGVGHACGHNLIAESGIAMALLTKELIQANPSKYPGKITVIGTPAEEGGGGKIYMMEAFKDVDAALMLHASNKGILHSETLCSSRLYVKFYSDERAATPHYFHMSEGPVGGTCSDAAIAAYNNITTLRVQIPQKWRIGEFSRPQSSLKNA